MKLKRKRPVEVPPKIRSFVNGVLATPLENIEEPLKTFVWDFDKGDFHHWVHLFNYFESFFEKYIKPRKDLLIEDDFLEHDPPFPRETVLQILRVVRVILENCTNRHLYSSYEHHLSLLLASTDADVVESCLQTFASFLKKSLGKHTIRDPSLSSKLFAFAQGWGPKEEGLGLLLCATDNESGSVSHELGSTLHFEFYEETDSLQIIHLPKVNTSQQSDLELMQKLVKEYKVPLNLRFSLLTRLRFTRSFVSFLKREQYTCIRLRAFIVFAQACGDTDDLVTFFNTEPEFINELVTLLTYEDTVSEKVRILSLNALVALCQDRLRQPTLLTTVTSGAHRGILSSLTHKAIDSVLSNSSESSSVVFAEALISLITILVSSSSGCSAMRESGFIPTLLPLLKDTNPRHLHLVSAAVHVLEAFMDYSNPAAALFRDLGGLDDTIFRLNVEVNHVENASKEQQTSEALVSYHRKSLMKALLRSISLGTYAPGTTSRVYDSEESLLLYCLRVIFKKAKDFGGGVFSLAAVVMSDLIHSDPTCFPILEASGLPSAFLDAITDNLLCSSAVLHCIPQCLDALCLNNSGLQAVKDRQALRSLVKVFTTKTYLRVLTGDLPSLLSSGLDELMRHASSLRAHGVNVLIEILNTVEKLGHCVETEDTNENSESFLPDCVNNAARLLENLLQNSDTCRLFIEMKGVEAVLKLFTLPLMPFSVSMGQSVAIAFKNFSPHHYASLARAICSFMKEHLKLTNEELVSLEGKQLSQVEDAKRTKVLRCLCILEWILSVLNSLSKGITNIVSEFGASDAHVLKDLGVTFKEILWQQSMFCDSKSDESISENANLGDDAASGASNNVVDDSTDSMMRYMNAVSSARNNSHLHSNLNSQAAIEREFLSMVRNGEGFSRRNRHRLARIRGGRTWRHFDAFHLESDSSINNTDPSSPSEDVKKKTPEVLVSETLNKLSSTLQSFFTSLLKGFTSTNRRRGETASLTTASKNIATTLAKLFLEALTFSGYNTSCPDLDTSLSLKCRYLGKVVDHMAVLTYDNKRGTCNTIMINNFYVQGTFKELLNTFEATSQLLWTLPYSVSTCGADSWLLNSLEGYCRALEFFINSSLILSPSSSSTSHNHLVLQPVEVGLSIILFPVPKDPKVFVRMLQSQVLDCILPIWSHPMFANCDPRFVTKIITLINRVYCGVDDAKLSHGGGTRSTSNAPDEAMISTLVEMGFTRRRAEEALRRVETNSVEMAMEWLFTHAEDPVLEENELAQALALSLGSSSENPPKEEEKSTDSESEAMETKAPPVDDVLASMMKLVELSDSVAFPLTELVTTLCTRNKGEDKTKVISYLIQQLKLFPLEFSKETSALCTISHSLASLLTEDITTRETALDNDIVPVSINILTNFIAARTRSQDELQIPKCISTLLLVLDSLLQPNTQTCGDKETNDGVEKIIGKSTGYLSIEEGERVVSIVCDMIKQRVPGMVMQAVLTVCGRLTKTHTLALRFLENGGMLALLNLPQTCMYETLLSIIIRHVIDDPHTLQTAMEGEIRKTLTTNRIAPRTFLTSMAPLISRDPEVFMKAASAVCQLESSGGRSVVVLSKENEKEKEKDKSNGVEIAESRPEDLQVKSKGQKKIPPNLTHVIHHLLEVILNYPSVNEEKECNRFSDAMEVDGHDPITSKGKSKVDETMTESESLLEGTDKVSQVMFILKLLSDILVMYPHAAGIILKHDLEISHGGILHHVVHRFLHPFIEKNDGSREKLSEKASSFLVALCGRSSEGRRRVIHELYKVLSSFSNSASNSSKGRLLPDKKILSFVDLLYSIMSKNSSSSNLIGCGCSPDIAKGMIGGGMIPCLSNVLGVLDLDHPDAPKVVNVILKVLEGLTRAANAAEQLSLSDKKKSVDQTVNNNTSINQTSEANQNSQHEVTGNGDIQQNLHDQTAVQEMRTDLEETETETVEGFIMHEEMEDNGVLHNTGDDDNDMADDDDDEDGIIPDDRAALMALADTDLEDHDETGLLEEFNDEMIDEEDNDPHENHVIEVRWREALYNLHDMQLLGQPEVDDLFGVGRPLGLDRRRLPNNHRTNVLRDPLLSRAIQSHEDAFRSLQSLTSDIRRAGIYDAPVIPYDHIVHASGGGGPPPYVSYSGGSRWTDDGQPQAAGQASAIAEAMEQQFMSRVRTTSPSSDHSASDSQVATGGGGGQQNENEGQQDEIEQNMVYLQPNQEQEQEQEQEHGPTVDVVDPLSNGQDNMEIAEGVENINEQEVQRDRLSAIDNETNNHELVIEGDNHVPVEENTDVDMNVADPVASDIETIREVDSLSEENTRVAQDNGQSQAEQSDASNAHGIDPAFLEALPEDLRAEVLASQQVRSTPAPAAADSSAVNEEIDPEFLAALPPDIQAEVLAQQRAQRLAQQAQGQPVDMDNASIIATFPADLRHEVLLTSSEAVISALPSPLLAEAQMLRDRAMSHYQARSFIYGNNHRLNNNRRNGLGLDRRTVLDRGVGVTIGHKSSLMLAQSLKVKDLEGEPLLDTDALKALIKLLRLAQPLGKNLLQRLLFNLCANSSTRENIVYLLLEMIKQETEGPVGALTEINSQRLYGCQSNVVYSRSQLIDGLPPVVLRRVLETLTYLARNHSWVSDFLFYFDSSSVPSHNDKKNDKGKEKVVEGEEMLNPDELSTESGVRVPILLFMKLLNSRLFPRSIAHLEQVLGLVQVVVHTAASKVESSSVDKSMSDELSTSDDQKSVKMFDIFMKLPQTDLHHLCSLLGHEGLSDKVYTLTGDVVKKLASVAPLHRKFFIVELSDLAHRLSSSAINELITLRNSQLLSLNAGSMAGASVLRILQTLNSLTSNKTKTSENDSDQEHITMWKLNVSLEPLWKELSECISVTESQLLQTSSSSVTVNTNVAGEQTHNSPLPPGTQRLLPFIESFLVLCEKLQEKSLNMQQDIAYATASEVKQLTGSGSESVSSLPSGVDSSTLTFSRFSEKHRRLLNAFIRQDPTLLGKSLSMLLKAPKLMDFDNKKSYFRSKIRQQHEQHLSGPLRISVRRAYILEDSYNQLRMRPMQDMKGRLNVHFQGEEGIDAGGLTREWYQVLSRVIFDKGALLFTTGGNNATFQPNPNSVYQTEHLSYFKFVGRVVAKALYDGQLLDVYFTRSFYKHILGAKVTYHDIEAVDPDYYKNLKWMLENDVSDIPDLTFSMDADEEKHILYEKTEVTDYELKPGGRNIRVTEETKHEYVDLVAEHILTNAIRPQINSFLEGFNELIPRELVSIFNDKELELLISGLPEIDFDDLKANTEYTGYTAGSNVVMWFWEVVKAFSKEDRARLLQFVTGTSKVPLEGFKALQGISGPQRFQIHKAYGAPERLPSAHTCFNQLDLPEYVSKEQLQQRLLLAIHEANEGFGFG